MGLLFSLRRRDAAAASAVPAPGDAAAVRQRAKRRLIGASVLLAIGVIGFPLVFETQPRPIPVDIPIEIPRKDKAAPLTLPGSPAAPAKATPAAAQKAVADPRPVAASASAMAGAASSASTRAAKPASSPAAVDAGDTARKDAATATPRSSTAPARGDDGLRAQALLEGRPAPVAGRASEPAAIRVVVQVGAYAEADKLRAARQKVEQLGLKTYTQVVEVDGATRTRVRVGPFATRQEAEQAAARIKAAGLPAAILVL